MQISSLSTYTSTPSTAIPISISLFSLPMRSYLLSNPAYKSTSFISMVMARSSTLRENEKVVSSIFTVPTTIRFCGMVIPSSKKRFLNASLFPVSSAVNTRYQSSVLFFRIGSVVIVPSSLLLRDSITLRNSAKYCSTGARFISSRQRK